jgi:Putative Flp pilus-assembly TadE/G-like
MKTIFTKALSEKRGGVLVFFALALIALTAMAGLALDAAHLYGVKSQLQVAADAAALAGANALTGSSATAMRNNAFGAATTVAGRNYADADPQTGLPRPVVLLPADVTCGIWNGTTFSPGNTTAMNAVEVVAKRTGASGQPMVQNGLIRVLSLLGATGFNQTGVIARAVAYRSKLVFAPVAVNEYVGPSTKGSYPHSYMRGTDVDGSTGWAGTTFAFFGEAANNNNTPKNTNGFVDLNYRSPEYNDNSSDWYSVTAGAGNCSDPLTGPAAAPNNGAVNSDKNTYKGYLNGSIPDSMVPANAIREPNVPLGIYDTSAAASYYLNSQPPYATLPHFSVGGSLSGVNWTVGQQLIVMVYDGITQGSGYDFVTVVGYGVVQVDSVGPPTWTGHAIKHGPMAGQDDPYIIQPSAANPTPSCSDMALMLQQLQQNFPVAKLVDSSEAQMHYGMTTH